MTTLITAAQLSGLGVEDAEDLAARIEPCMAEKTGERRWQRLVAEVFCGPLPLKRLPFAVHQLCFASAYGDRNLHGPPSPAWLPAMAAEGETNVRRLARAVGADDVPSLHRWSIQHRPDFWQIMVKELGIIFHGAPGPAWRNGLWFPSARLNIAESCLWPSDTNETPAIIYRDAKDMPLTTVSRDELAKLAYAVAGHCQRSGLDTGARVVLYLPMTVEAVASYLGVILAGCTVVSIADSFAAQQVAIRIGITGASLAIVTTGTYKRLVAASPDLETIFVNGLPDGCAPRAIDTAWEEVIAEPAEAIICPSAAHTNILFSSGTTGEPKAIPWTHLTPIKCAVDAHLLHDVRPGEVLSWPTSLGWMMGPWLIYAALLNQATIALYYPGPKESDFGRFVHDANVSMLGLVPSLTRMWRYARCMERIDWRCIRRFSSTGECSDPTDQLYLMALAGYRPIIEYCGGTEIGGGYLSATMEQPAAPATFTTPAFGLGIAIYDERDSPSETGELYLMPPSIGLSTELLNQNHEQVYLSGTPQLEGQSLRRHGDHIQRLPGGYFRALGRVDDTMNLVGIKVSAAEIERAIAMVEGLDECAAVAAPSRSGGPDRLVVFAVLRHPIANLRQTLQRALSERLNPMFKIAEVRLIDALPRTASNKVMRQELRADCSSQP